MTYPSNTTLLTTAERGTCHTRSGSFEPIVPEPSPWLLLLGYLQPFATPDALHSIFPHLPACRPQQRRDPPVAVTAILTGQGNDCSSQRIFIHSLDRHVALRSAPLIHQPASMPLGKLMLLLRMLYRTAPPLRA